MSEVAYIALVILVYGTVLTGLVYFAIKRTRLFIILLGIVAILAALPIGFIAEVGINGCCGAPSTGNEGDGFAIGALIGVAGIISIAVSSRFKKKKPQ